MMTKDIVSAGTLEVPVSVKKQEIVLNLLLDESGSMQCVREKTVEGINEYLGGLLDDPNADYLYTLTKFDAHMGPHCRVVHRLKTLKDVGPMNLNDYEPRGSTPLLDAVGETIRAVENDVGERSVIFIVITDGYENASKEFNKEQITKLIAEKEATGKWTFIYLGANQNAWANSAQYGFKHGNVMSFNSANINHAYSALRNVTYARSANVVSGAGATCSAFADAGYAGSSLEENLGLKPDQTPTLTVRDFNIDRIKKQVITDLTSKAAKAKNAKTSPEERHRQAQEAAKARWNK